MSFNSFEFWVFFGVVYFLYRFLNRPAQNSLLLLASYVFYFSIARAFVLLLIVTTFLDFYCAKMIAASASINRRRLFLSLSVLGNVTLLVSFKYFDLVANRFGAAIGHDFTGSFFAYAAPVGLSFYILQSVGYVVDVFRKEQEPHRNFLEYAAFIAFFPQLLAGPIERAHDMLPQFARRRAVTRESITSGIWLCFWGIVEKTVISDNLQSRVIAPYFQSGPSNGFATAIVLWSCGVRIYCDFGGYSNIARGLARLMGFELSVNFYLGGLAVSTRDLWRRFHITFFRWMKDYVYRPLRHSLGLPAWLSVLVVFVCSGLWHRLSVPFFFWGLYHGIIILVCEIPGRFIEPIYEAARGIPKLAMTGAAMLLTKFLMGIGMAFFFADSMQVALLRLRSVLDFPDWRFDQRVGQILLLYFFFNFPRYLVEAAQIRRQNPLGVMEISPIVRAALVFILFLYLVVYGVTNAEDFVYFQF